MTDDAAARTAEQQEHPVHDVLNEIAERLGMTVSMLRSQPDDVQQMIRAVFLQTQNDDAAFRKRMQQIMDVSPVTDELPPKQPKRKAQKPERHHGKFTFSRRRLHELAMNAKAAAQSSRTAAQEQNETQKEIIRKKESS